VAFGIATRLPVRGTVRNVAEVRVFSVSQLNAEVRQLLEQSYVAVRGELSEVRTSPSWALAYFSLKDASAEIPCVMPRIFFTELGLVEGTLVTAHGRLSLYERRGRFQLMCDSLEAAGRGALAAKVEALKKKLEGEGLFSAEGKRALPEYPERIGVVSSSDGAAYQDFAKVAHERLPGLTLVLADVHVQGAGAVGEIVQAFRGFARLHEQRPVDLVVVTRGGGSLEDLMAFNDEGVARAIADCPVPVISAVGHERDVTIADLVADVRASTPSNAAELAVPEASELIASILHLTDRANNALQHSVAARHEQLELLLARPVLRDATSLLAQKLQRVTDAHARLGIVRERFRLAPARVEALVTRLRAAAPHLTRRYAERTASLLAKAQALSPEAVLTRGFSITTTRDGSVVRDAASVTSGSPLDVRLKHGRLSVTVDDTSDDQS
jgi:exodeoxyribonuclease VII large subunit